MTQQTKSRLAWLDVAKAITMLLIVFGHTLRGGTASQIVYSFHVATFFILSGMTCKGDDLPTRIKNDFLRIMMPYYFFSILSILAFSVLGQFAANHLSLGVNTSLSYNFVGMIYGSPINGHLRFNLPLWFLPCLFVTKLLYYAINKLCREKPLLLLICSFGVAVLGCIYTRLGGPLLPFNLSVSAKMLFFFSLGRVSFQRLSSKKHCFTGFKALVSGTALLLTACIIGAISARVDYATDFFPSYAVFLVTALLGSYGIIFLSIGLKGCKVLEYVGKSTLGILVMHKFPVLLFQTIGPQTVLLERIDSIVGVIISLVVSVIAIVLCLAVTFFINRYLPFLLGDFSKMKPKLRKENL